MRINSSISGDSVRPLSPAKEGSVSMRSTTMANNTVLSEILSSYVEREEMVLTYIPCTNSNHSLISVMVVSVNITLHIATLTNNIMCWVTVYPGKPRRKYLHNISHL